MDIVQAAAVSWHPRASTSSSGSGLNCTRAQVRDAFRGDIGRREISCRLRLSDPRRTAGREQYFASTTRWQKSGAARIVVNSMKTDADEVQKVEEKDEEKGGRSFLTFLCPLLKLLGSGDPAAPRNVFLETTTSGFASIARLPWGSKVNAEVVAERGETGQPPQLLQLYEFEACPFCRRVREALTELDLSVEVYPCPKGSLKHRDFVKKNGGQEQFPYLIDPNTGASMFESSEIVSYLFKQYGGGREPSPGLLESTLVTGWVPTILRAGRGMMLYSKASSDTPSQKLELYSYENNQFARLVRETLCELEIPYILRNAGKGSALRGSLLKLAGSTKVPYLVDPNTGRSMGESQDIISYLFATYGVKN
ncbi:protein MpGST1 [Marchantia polymorpha subsp. ruderalis]|uniref:GST N-terminal domain-containing protein n=2 Tax=Marchantia polymorpha TaxID=3197 RepID=A0AAF6BMW2_MARPO|nr:hypothetical protein MARPO_0035s0064 [Marchantia polymorpha]BBN13346.1 hypothetical protein Mp_6g02770 [Marchantia polymorpha subsp. ruderalis]|eukprot:PTQ41274.1 hypothetical protein MARPO_0035s0064 [Marchantia polymorpha]